MLSTGVQTNTEVFGNSPLLNTLQLNAGSAFDLALDEAADDTIRDGTVGTRDLLELHCL
jgi:hypothetical protein